jgi:hypothetical protein
MTHLTAITRIMPMTAHGDLARQARSLLAIMPITAHRDLGLPDQAPVARSKRPRPKDPSAFTPLSHLAR